MINSTKVVMLLNFQKQLIVKLNQVQGQRNFEKILVRKEKQEMII